MLRCTSRYNLRVQQVFMGWSMAEIRTVGVIGAGQMGNGIAHVSALAGYEVVLTDVSEAALARGSRPLRQT